MRTPYPPPPQAFAVAAAATTTTKPIALERIQFFVKQLMIVSFMCSVVFDGEFVFALPVCLGERKGGGTVTNCYERIFGGQKCPRNIGPEHYQLLTSPGCTSGAIRRSAENRLTSPSRQLRSGLAS